MRHFHNPWTPPASEEEAVPGLLSVLTPAVVFGHRGRANEWSTIVPETDKPSKLVKSKYCLGEFLDARHGAEPNDVETHGVCVLNMPNWSPVSTVGALVLSGATDVANGAQV